MKSKHVLLSAAISSIVIGMSPQVFADTFTTALTEGKANGDIRIRYESVDQDNALEDATALTMRTRIGYTTGAVSGFSAMAEFEDVRVIADIDDYSQPGAGGEFSVIADPEVTELDQGFLQYKTGGLTAKLGRQVITMDNHRFIGHVGWRQDRQTFDAALINYVTGDITLNYAYLDQRERIFGQAGDIDSKDHIFNASYKTPVGTVTGYGYLLEMDNDTDNAVDTFGVRFVGAKDKFSYAAEFATQSYESGDTDADADYMMLEGGYKLGEVKLGLLYEVLGSDDGAYGFATPLATLHAFNGWADIFLATPTVGLVDIAVSVSGKAGPGSWALAYHEFSADESTSEVDDLGSEIDASYSLSFAEHYNAGVKLALYSEGDTAPDTNKAWLWVGATF